MLEVDRRIFLWILKNYSIKSRLKQIRTSCTFFFFFRNDYSRQDNRIHFCAFHSRIVYWDTIFLCLLKNKTPFSFRLKLIDDGEMSKVIRIKDIIKNNDKKNFLVPLLHSQNGIWQFPLFLSFVWILKKKKKSNISKLSISKNYITKYPQKSVLHRSMLNPFEKKNFPKQSLFVKRSISTWPPLPGIVGLQDRPILKIFAFPRVGSESVVRGKKS